MVAQASFLFLSPENLVIPDEPMEWGGVPRN